MLELDDGQELALGGDGYLQDWTRWSSAVAEAMARSDDMILTENHWTVIRLLRDYYGEYEISPPMRALLKLMREQFTDETIDSRALYRMFPEGPAKQACRYAGLPRPVSCI